MPGDRGDLERKGLRRDTRSVERETSVAGSVAKFAAAGLAAVALVGVASAAIIRRTATDEAVRQAKELTELAGEGIVEPAIGPGLAAGDPRALRRVDRVVRARVLRDPVVRVKVWTPQGRIIYSDEPALIGATYRLPEDERDALRTGKVKAEISDLTRPENSRERQYGKLLEVYLPVRTPEGEPVLFESYSRFSSIAASRRRQLEALAPALIGSLLLLVLIQVPIAWSLARRLRQRQREREALLRRTIEASDAERRRIAASLHEGVVQDLAGLALSLSAAAAADGSSGETLRGAASQARHAMRKLRATLVDLHPPSLRRAGLAAALEDLAGSLSARGTEVEVTAEPDLPADVAELLFRTAAEALRNVEKHAGAAHVRVRAERNGSVARLSVRDDGRGFDPQAPRGDDHIGLLLLEDLAVAAGGRLELRSEPGQGTTLLVEVPL